MLKKFYPILLLGIILILGACKTAFDEIIANPNPQLKKEKAFDYYAEGDYYKAQLLFEQVMPLYRGKDSIEIIYFHYAYTHYNLNKYILASYYFKNFTTTFPKSKYAEEALYMNAYANYQLSPSPKLEQSYTIKAIDEFQKFVNQYPTSDKVDKCNALMEELRAKLEDKAVAAAELYFKVKNYQSANHAFANVLRDYPDSKKAESVRLMVIISAFRLAENSVEFKQIERYQETLDYCVDFKERYPNSDNLKQVEGIRKTSAEKLKKLSS